MAAPVVASTNSGHSNGNVSSQVISMPSGITAGDLLLVFASTDGGSDTNLAATGWTKLGQANSSNDVGCAVFYKTAAGSDTCTVTGLASEHCAWNSYRITGAATTPSGSSATGASDNPDPPNHNAGSSSDHLWIAAYAGDSDDANSGYPSGYSGGFNAVGTSGLHTITASANKQTTATTSENPGTFSRPGGEQWAAWTIAVPAGAPPAIERGGNDTEALTDSHVRTHTATRSASDPVGVVDSSDVTLWKTYDVSGLEGANVTDSVVFTASLGRSEDVGCADSASVFRLRSAGHADDAGSSDSVSVEKGLVPSDEVGATDTAGLIVSYSRAAGESSGLSDEFSRTLQRSVSDDTGASDSRSLQLVIDVSDDVGATDPVSLTRTLVRGGSAGATDTVSVGILLSRDADEAAGLSDDAALTVTYARSETDSVGLLDTVSGNVVQVDRVGLGDSAALTVDSTRAVSDEIGLSDAVSLARVWTREVTDGAIGTDVSSRAVSYTREFVDAAGLSDRTNQETSATDPAGVSDDAEVSIIRSRTRSDAVSVTDSAVLGFTRHKSFTDRMRLIDRELPGSVQLTVRDVYAAHVGLADSAVVSLHRHVEAEESAGLVDGIERYVDAEDVSALSDSVSMVLRKAVSDRARLTDFPRVQKHISRSFSDPAGLADAPTVSARDHEVGVESAGLADSVSLTLVRGVSDTLAVTDTETHPRTRTVRDTARLSDSRAISLFKSVSDSVKLIDSEFVREDELETVEQPETTGLSDAVGLAFTIARSDELTTTDSVGTGVSFARSRSDRLRLSDSASLRRVHGRPTEDHAVLSDSAEVTVVYGVADADGLALTDSHAITWAYGERAADAVVLTDRFGISRTLNSARANEPAKLSDSFTINEVENDFYGDTADVSDSFSVTVHKHTPDLVSITDSVLIEHTRVRLEVDDTGVIDRVAFTRTSSVFASAGLSDSVSISKVGPTNLTIKTGSDKWRTGQGRLGWGVSEASIVWGS